MATTLTNTSITTDTINVDSGVLYVDNTNNRVGVGTASPTEVVEVRDGTVLLASTTTSPSLQIQRNDGSGNVAQAGFNVFGSASNIQPRLAIGVGSAGSAPSAKLFIGENGNVGIGESSPDRQLHITDASEVNLKLEAGSDIAEIRLKDSDNALTVHLDNNERMGLKANEVNWTNSTAGFYNKIWGPSSGDIASGYLTYRGSTLRGGFYTNPSHGLTVISEVDITFRANNANRVSIDQSGRVTIPGQPCFGAILGAHIYTPNYLTGWTAQTNVGSHFNAGDGTFTAPVTGQYYFYVSVMRATNDSGDYSVQIRKNGSAVRLSNDMANGSYITYMQTTVPAVLTLAANDNIRFYIGNTVTTSHAYQGTYTHCGGYLIG